MMAMKLLEMYQMRYGRYEVIRYLCQIDKKLEALVELKAPEVSMQAGDVKLGVVETVGCIVKNMREYYVSYDS